MTTGVIIHWLEVRTKTGGEKGIGQFDQPSNQTNQFRNRRLEQDYKPDDCGWLGTSGYPQMGGDSQGNDHVIRGLELPVPSPDFQGRGAGNQCNHQWPMIQSNMHIKHVPP